MILISMHALLESRNEHMLTRHVNNLAISELTESNTHEATLEGI